MSEQERKISLNFETIGSIAAMVIGATALFVAWDQAQVMRKQQHASVWPLLSDDFTIDKNEDGYVVELTLANKGVGPALIESAYVTIDGEPASSRPAFMQGVFKNQQPAGSARVNGSSIEGSALGAGDAVSVFKVTWPDTEDNRQSFSALANRYVDGEGPQVSLAVCFCSVFERCFLSEDQYRPRGVKACPEQTDMFTNLLRDQSGADQ
ncbi:hypothetical protein PUV54_07470 [Hyphococcus flavus]|uniref:Uncharacterized protein n=1 Tax=Hyphococcus flavus TaxID=1866326 RepID=A0AAE9ZDX1_9PROT|nr:hypothetical protein [Hyphococcus flavus]WDI33034.1 hypothetical protein PUV54_07470 [Hyphococcus flavus]